MAENDAMEGKKLELHMFEQKILEAIEIAKKQKQDTGVIENGQMPFEIKIERVDKKIKIHAFGEEILTLEEGDKFTYNLEGLKNIREKLEENPEFDYKQFGLPDIEYLEELDKQREEEQKDEKDLPKDMGEKEDDEKEPKGKEEKEEDEKEQEEKPKEQKKNLIKLNDKVIKILCPSAKEYGNIYLDPDTGELVGKNKQTHEVEPVRGLSQIKGTNSDKNIHGMEDGKHKHVNALRMYQIDSRPNTGFSVIRDGTEKGNFDVKFTIRKLDSNDIRDFAYVDIPLLASQTRMGEERAEEISGERQGMRGQGEQDRVQDEVDELNEKVDVPEDIVNSFNDEMQRQSNNITSLKQFKDMLYKVVKEKLDKERPNDFPDSHKAHAKAIVDEMVEKNKGYEEAKDEVYNGKGKSDNNDNEKQPGENPRKRGH